jgi:hypothetical protein
VTIKHFKINIESNMIGLGCSSVTECMLSMCEALVPSPAPSKLSVYDIFDIL